MAAEREATHRAIALAEIVGVPIQIFHVSGAEPAEEIRRAQARGLEVYGETHPHYLLLNECDADRPGFEGAKFLCSPPLRTVADNEALWSYLREGVLQAITSDHSPFNYCGAAGKQVGGPDAGFDRIPNGLPTIETRLPMLFSEGVSKGRIDLATFVSLSATGPARIFGLYPRKGRIAIGVDAGSGAVGPGTRSHDHQRRPAPQRRLHPLRGLVGQGMAGDHYLPGCTNRARGRGHRRAGIRALPAARATRAHPARCNRRPRRRTCPNRPRREHGATPMTTRRTVKAEVCGAP